jgi:Rieske Fe-S protein
MMGPDSCDGCGLGVSRRDFVRELGMVLGALAAVGASLSEPALALSRVGGVRGLGETVRYPIPTQDGAQIDTTQEVILVRWQNAVYAFNLSCPHQRTALKWLAEDTRFQCPKHKSKYTPDGAFISGRATRGMDRFSLKREGNEVVVDLDDMHKQDKDPDGWNAAVVKLS